MSDPSDDPTLLALWATALSKEAPPSDQRARLMAALEAEPFLPFCAELARHVDLSQQEVRALLAQSAKPDAWTRSTPPVAGYIDFEPGPRVAPLRAGFVKLSGGARLARHEHLERELTFVLEGVLIDDGDRRYLPGDIIDMPIGSAHALSVPDDGKATVVLLHGRIRSA
jgi:quercetin dioxygenase-like cupin family protein